MICLNLGRPYHFPASQTMPLSSLSQATSPKIGDHLLHSQAHHSSSSVHAAHVISPAQEAAKVGFFRVWLLGFVKCRVMCNWIVHSYERITLLKWNNMASNEIKGLVLIVATVSTVILLFQSSLVTHKSAILAGVPTNNRLNPASIVKDVGFSTPERVISSTDQSKHAIAKDERVEFRVDFKAERGNIVEEKDLNLVNGPEEGTNGTKEDWIDLDEDVPIKDIVSGRDDIESTNSFILGSRGAPKNGTTIEDVTNLGKMDSMELLRPVQGLSSGKIQNATKEDLILPYVAPLSNIDTNVVLDNNVKLESGGLVSSPSLQTTVQSVEILPGEVDDHSAQDSRNITVNLILPEEKRKSTSRQIITISGMDRILQTSHITFSLKLSNPSNRDRELLSARSLIANAPTVHNIRDLYPPLFRNVSRFIKSYELMERILKVYVYKDGERPIFHTPILKGIYASEGWFLKLMERNKHYTVKDHRKAHLFYLPFNSRLLEFAFAKRGLTKPDMANRMRDYVDTISRKYPFWNRTGGADHFLAGCHDWAPYETTPHLLTTIRALCNADVSEGFKIGKDVSLPETYVRSARNPLRDLGGNSAANRPHLAFFAGNMHGLVRPTLLQHWEGKDPDMKIFGPFPRGKKNKMNYIGYMKNSKYCICPKGYEVNSPRVVEAIFYECVPVIISDNFVPPFFEVLNWEAFAIFVAEKDIPNLKNILLSIPEKKYMTMQGRVKRLQQHFLWHDAPVKYDLFHMILHSIWQNRVNLITL